MSQKELANTFMLISIREKPFSLLGLNKNKSALQGLTKPAEGYMNCVGTCWVWHHVIISIETLLYTSQGHRRLQRWASGRHMWRQKQNICNVNINKTT